MQSTGLCGVGGDLGAQCLDVREANLGAEKVVEFDLDVVLVNVGVEIKKMHLQHALAGGIADGRADADIGDAGVPLGADFRDLCANGIDAVGWELLAFGREIGGGESELASHFPPLTHGAVDAKWATKQTLGGGKIARLNGGADGGAAYDLPFDGDGWEADGFESQGVAEELEEGEISFAPVAKCPVLPDANLAQFARVREVGDEVGGQGFGKRGIKRNDECIGDAKLGEEREFMPRGGEQRWGLFGAQELRGMGIEGDDDGVFAAGAEGFGDDGLVAEMHPIKDADGQGHWARQGGEFSDVMVDFHRLRAA